jgi:hypothetical protein
MADMWVTAEGTSAIAGDRGPRWIADFSAADPAAIPA